MILSSTIEEIRNKADILQIVSEYVPMKKRGKNYIGLCPFHSEKTPSFTVSPEKQIFHCFGCNEGGNVFAFLMKAENMSFAEAVELLGEKVGIAVKKSGQPATAQSEKDRYFEIMELAQRFYRECLESAEGGSARKYLEKRGIPADIAASFALGYSPDKWDCLLNFLFKKGVAQKDMEKLGLIIERSDKSGFYDRFRGRLMFPIYNIRGKIIAFGGRIISGNEEAKYINSPDSPIYNKGYSLYGINLTKDEIKKTRTAVLVEGNFDLITCYQFGIKNVTAPMGTALTVNQAKALHRFADKVILAFDSDSAGNLATGRSVDIFRDEGLDVYAANYEGGKDPDEALRAKGAESFTASLKEALPWAQYKIITAIKRHNLKEIEGRAKAAKEAAFIISQEKEELLRKGYIKMVAEKLGYTHEEISSEVKRLGFYMKKGPDSLLKRSIEKPALKIEKAEECLIKLSIGNKEVLETFKSSISWQEFTGSLTRTIAELLQSVDIDTAENLTHFMMENMPDEESRKLLSKIMVNDYPESTPLEVAGDCIKTIKAHHLKSKMEHLRGEIIAAEKEGKLENVSALHREFRDLNDAYRSLSA